jgi:hypothetical protein
MRVFSGLGDRCDGLGHHDGRGALRILGAVVVVGVFTDIWN